MNNENLIPFEKLSESEQREIRSKGGKASGEARRRRKTQREFLENALDMKIKTIPKLTKLAERLGINADECTLQELLTIKLLLNTADKSDISSLKDVTALLGEQSESVENNGILNDLAAYLKGKNNAE